MSQGVVQSPSKDTGVSAPDGSHLYSTTVAFELWAGSWRALQVIKYGAYGFVPFLVLLFAFGLLGAKFDAGGIFNPGAGLVTWGGWWLTFYTLVMLFLAAALGYGNVANSLLTWFAIDDDMRSEELKLVEGAREIAKHTPEFEKIRTAHAEIASRSGGRVREPRGWVIIESALPNTYTIGHLIFLTRGAIDSPHLAALMAHELGHLKQEDGEILLALRRFIYDTAYRFGIDRQPSGIGSVSGNSATMVVTSNDQQFYYRMKSMELQEDLAWNYGGIGMLRLGAMWADFWRACDFAADHFVFELGMAEHLIAALEAYSAFDVAQPYRMSGRPYAAERIEVLRIKLAQ